MSPKQKISVCLVLTDPITLWPEVLKSLDEYLVLPNLEIVVLDLSREHALTLTLRESFPYLKWVQVSENLELDALWQRYHYLLKGPVVVWMSLPVLLMAGHLEASLAVLKAEPSVVVLPDLVRIKNKRSIGPKLPFKNYTQKLSSAKLQALPPGLCVFLKRPEKDNKKSFWDMFADSGKVPVWHSEQLKVSTPC